MGDDYFNPYTAAKPIPVWKLALAFLALIAIFDLAVWETTVALFSLDPVNVAVKK